MAEISAGPAVPRVTADAAIAAKTPEQREALMAQLRAQQVAFWRASGYTDEEIVAALEAIRDEIVGGPDPAVPTVTGINPTSAVVGDPTDVTMHVLGTNFTAETKILFNNLEEPIVFISETDITTIVKPSLFVVPAVCPVSVVGATESVPFEFTEPVP